MTQDSPKACSGRSAFSGCQVAPAFTVSRSAGKGRTKELHACGRHISWLLNYTMVPGWTVSVTRLR